MKTNVWRERKKGVIKLQPQDQALLYSWMYQIRKVAADTDHVTWLAIQLASFSISYGIILSLWVWLVWGSWWNFHIINDLWYPSDLNWVKTMTDTSRSTMGIAFELHWSLPWQHIVTNHCLLPNNGCTHHFNNNNNCGEGGISRAAIYCTRWEQRMLYNNTNNTHTNTYRTGE